jgi:hypothetical protein
LEAGVSAVDNVGQRVAFSPKLHTVMISAAHNHQTDARKAFKAVRFGLWILAALAAIYLLAYGPVWSLAARGAISWNTLQTLYRPVPIRAQRLLHNLWKPTGLLENPPASDRDPVSNPPAPSSTQK